MAKMHSNCAVVFGNRSKKWLSKSEIAKEGIRRIAERLFRFYHLTQSEMEAELAVKEIATIYQTHCQKI